jgi:RNA polymerase primary sigma factor
LYEVISRINKAKKMLAQEHGRQPHDEEVAELVGMTVDKLKTVVKSARAPTSMERPIGKEKDSTVGVGISGTSWIGYSCCLAFSLHVQMFLSVLCSVS